MTIMNLIRRYKRWNPVHPTYGAFWGVGVGLGCGVGWGPGFGPEAVGFVGSGCGVGFSVGVTMIGLGIGLPASGFTCLPWDALVLTGKGASNVTSSFVLPTVVFIAQQSWGALSSQAIAIDRGVQNLYRTQAPRSKKLKLESRRQFLQKGQKDAPTKGVTQEDPVLQMEPLDANQLSESAQRAQSVSFGSRRSGAPSLPGDSDNKT